MIFSAIPLGSSVFIDANTFVYDFSAHQKYGAACKQLLQRIARQELQGFTSAHVLCDLAHRGMTLEAMDQFGWQAKGIALRLRKHPALVQKLSRYRQAVEEVPRIGIQVFPLDLPLVTSSTPLSQQYGLLTGDALIVALMRQHGLTSLASEDADFDSVPGITRYAPA